MSKKDTSLSSDQIISVLEAQRRVSRFVILEIGERLSGGKPVEVRESDGRIYWSVPVMLEIPGEPTRNVGKILVDAVTGKLQMTEAVLAEITAKAERLAEDLVSI